MATQLAYSHFKQRLHPSLSSSSSALLAVCNAVMIATALLLLPLVSSCHQAHTQSAVQTPVSAPQVGGDAIIPEYAGAFRQVALARADRFMVASADPYATEAGLTMLRAGGSAIDAAVAVVATLTLVEPQSSGIGGGAFMLHWDAKARKLVAFDGRETAPATATPNLFLQPDGTPMEFFEAVVGGRSVGVPGILRMLEMAHKQHGKLPWSDLFKPAITLADNGFKISQRLHDQMTSNDRMQVRAALHNYLFTPEGTPKTPGTVLKDPELAHVLRTIAQHGADAFYKGAIAESIVTAVHNDPNPGRLSLTDMADYQAKAREPVCMPYRAYQICGMPPPSAGGISVLQIMGILNTFDLNQSGPLGLQTVHLFTQATRLAYADRDEYVGDPDFVSVPVMGLLNPTYLKQRAKLITRKTDMGKVQPGTPESLGMVGAVDRAPHTSPVDLPSTSHFAIADASGNVVSLTASIENGFGSRIFTRGFILNNQLTDFSFVPEKNGKPVANAIAPGKRPRSAMAPTIVFDRKTGQPVLAIGSPGGSRIIAYVAQGLLNTLTFQLNPQEAITLPHIFNRNDVTEIETNPFFPETVELLAKGLKDMGHQVTLGPQNSGIQAIQRTSSGKFLGAADPRREGLAKGD